MSSAAVTADGMVSHPEDPSELHQFPATKSSGPAATLKASERARRFLSALPQQSTLESESERDGAPMTMFEDWPLGTGFGALDSATDVRLLKYEAGTNTCNLSSSSRLFKVSRSPFVLFPDFFFFLLSQPGSPSVSSQFSPIATTLPNTQPQTMAPVTRGTSRAQRREAVLEALETAAVVIDLTIADSPPTPLKWEDLAVRPVSFTTESGDNTRTKAQSYTLTIDGWKGDDDGSLLIGLVDVHSVTEVVLRPATGYPVHFILRPDDGGRSLVGARTYEYYEDDRDYGGDGDNGPAMSLDLGQLGAMIWQPWTERGFIASVGFAE